MADELTERLLGLVHDAAETNAKVANELEHLHDAVSTLASAVGTQQASLDQLVGLLRARDEREQTEVEAEIKRREASAEAEARRVAFDIAERQSRSAWLRDQAARLVGPVAAALALVLTGIAGAVSAWFGAHFHAGADR